MKRKALATIATLIVLSGTVFLPAGTFLVSTFGAQTAHAQTVDPTGAGTTTGPYAPSYTPAAGPANPTVTPPADTTVTGEFKCSIGDILCGLVKFADFILTSATGLIANVAAIILDFSIKFSISSSTYSDPAVANILISGWKLIRDFSTIFLMFALFVVAFMLIFNAEGSEGSWAAHFSPGRTIARVIIVALLVNFSFLMCRSVIEIGNVFALVLYDKVDQGNQSISTYATTSAAGKLKAYGSGALVGTPFEGTKSISVGILANINPQRVLLSQAGKIYSVGDDNFLIDYLFLSFVVAIINLLLIFVFVSMFVLFIGRVIGLYLGVILSPFAFVSWTIPFMSNLPFIGFDNWLKELIGFTFLGPVYLLFVYLTVAFMKIPNPTSNSNLFALSAFAIIDALLCLFVLMKGKKIAESMAGEFGTMVSKFAGVIATAGVGLATGGVGFVASQTIGRAGNALATNSRLNQVANSGDQNNPNSANSQSVQQKQQQLGATSGARGIGVRSYKPGTFGKPLANSTAGNSSQFSFANLKSSAARNVQNMGKSLATFNPLNSKILGTSVVGAAAAIGKLAGDKTLTDGLAKNQANFAKKSADTVKKIDEKNAPAPQVSLAGNQALGNIGGNKNTQTSAPATPATGTAPTTATSTTTPPPPNTPPTGGATPAGAGNPPRTGGLPIRLAGNAPIDQKPSGVTMPRTMFNGNLKPQAPATQPAVSPILDKNGTSVNAPAATAPVTILDRFGKPMNAQNDTPIRPTLISTPATQSGSNATNFLSGIQATAPAAQTNPVVINPQPVAQTTQSTTPQPAVQQSQPVIEQKPVQQTIVSKPIQNIVEQPPQTVVKQENAIQQASTIAGTNNEAVRNVSAKQENLGADREKFITGATNLYNSLGQASSQLQNNSRPGYDIVPEDTVHGLIRAGARVQDAIEQAKAGGELNHEAIHEALQGVHSSLEEVNSTNTRGADSEVWKGQSNALNRLNEELSKHLPTIEKSLSEDKREEFAQRAKTTLDQSQDVAYATKKRSDIINGNS